MVHESLGPVAGEASQNCVCKSCPPGALKQQVSLTAVLFWQDVCGFVQVGGEPPRTAGHASWTSASLERERRDGYKEGMFVNLKRRLQAEEFREGEGFCR